MWERLAFFAVRWDGSRRDKGDRVRRRLSRWSSALVSVGACGPCAGCMQWSNEWSTEESMEAAYAVFPMELPNLPGSLWKQRILTCDEQVLHLLVLAR